MTGAVTTQVIGPQHQRTALVRFHSRVDVRCIRWHIPHPVAHGLFCGKTGIPGGRLVMALLCSLVLSIVRPSAAVLRLQVEFCPAVCRHRLVSVEWWPSVSAPSMYAATQNFLQDQPSGGGPSTTGARWWLAKVPGMSPVAFRYFTCLFWATGTCLSLYFWLLQQRQEG